jgi:uncharacterized iron-regulated membrane protein
MSRRRFLKPLHLYLGLTLGVLFVVSATSGVILILKPRLEITGTATRAAPPQQATVAVLGSALNRRGADGLTMIQLPADRRPTYQIWFEANGVEHIEYVDAQSLKPILLRSSDSDWLLMLFHLHTELLSGQAGERLLGVTGFLYVGILVTGLIVWWPGTSRLGRILALPKTTSLRARYHWLHRFAGALAAPLLLVAVLTGLGMIHYEKVQSTLLALTGGQQPAMPPAAVDCPAGRTHLPWQLQLARVHAALPEARLIRIYPATEANRPNRFRLKHPEEWHQNGRSLVYLNPCDGSVVFSRDARRMPLAIRLSHAIYPLHSAHVGGSVYRAIMLAIALMPCLLLLTGLLTWLNRRNADR